MTRVLLVLFLAATTVWALPPDTTCWHAVGCTDIEIPQTPTTPNTSVFTGLVPKACKIGRLWSTGTDLCVCTALNTWKCVAVATTSTTTTTTVTTTTATTTTVTTTTVTTTT